MYVQFNLILQNLECTIIESNQDILIKIELNNIILTVMEQFCIVSVATLFLYLYEKAKMCCNYTGLQLWFGVKCSMGNFNSNRNLTIRPGPCYFHEN